MQDQIRVITCPPRCTLAEAETLRDMFILEMNAVPPQPLSIDLSAIAEADVSFVQLLVSAQKLATLKTIALTFRPSPVIDDLMRVAGLADWPTQQRPN